MDITKILYPIPDVCLERELVLRRIFDSEEGYSFNIEGSDIIKYESEEKKHASDDAISYVHLKLKDNDSKQYYLQNGALSIDFGVQRNSNSRNNAWDKPLREMRFIPFNIEYSSMMDTNFLLLKEEDNLLKFYIDGNEVPYNENFFNLFFDTIGQDFQLFKDEYEKYYSKLHNKGKHVITFKKNGKWSDQREEYYKSQYVFNQLGFLKCKESLYPIFSYKMDKENAEKISNKFEEYYDNHFIMNHEDDIVIQKVMLDKKFAEYILKNHKDISNEDVLNKFIKNKEHVLNCRNYDLPKIRLFVELLKNQYPE